MKNEEAASNLLDLLNQALARELQVVIQYMLQHGIGAGQTLAGAWPTSKQNKFVASHAQVWLPGQTLKKIAITEMRHAEAIAERVVHLGGEPTTQPAPVTIGKATSEMLALNQHEERGAIELYRRIIEFAGQQHDDVTANLFRQILGDEEKHLKVFSDLLAAG
jgi:bacterioferritin